MWKSALHEATLNPFIQPVCRSVLVQAPVPVTEDSQRSQMTSTTSAPSSPQEAVEVRTENLFQRTEVLAGMRKHSSLHLPEVELLSSCPAAPRSSSWGIPRERLCQWQTSKSWKPWNYFPLLSPIWSTSQNKAFIRLHFWRAEGPCRVHSRGCFSLWKHERWREADDGNGNLCALSLTPSHFPCVTEANVDWHFTFTQFWYHLLLARGRKTRKRTDQDSRETVRRQPSVSRAPLQIYFVPACWIEAKLALYTRSPAAIPYLRLWLVYLSSHLESRNAVAGRPGVGGSDEEWTRTGQKAAVSYSCFSFCSASAVIAGGVIGFLFAIFLILLLVYRMRKKDEGSYDLGERKPSGAAYQKAPTKEFYA